MITTTLEHKGYEKYVISKDWNEGKSVQYIFKFPNNYGASVIKGPGTFGYKYDLWEVGVLWWDKDGRGGLCYDTEITNDVLENLSDEEVLHILDKIMLLKE